MTNYWIFKVKDEAGGLYGRKGLDIFMHRTKEGFWSIRELDENGKHEPNIDSLKKDDYAVFYLIGKNSNRFIGTCVLDSDYTRLDQDQARYLIHREYVDTDQGVFIKDVDRWAKTLPIELLRGKASFIPGRKVGLFFQGSIKKMKSVGDYEAIIRAHKEL